MSLFENFPYTNLHNLNLDWVLRKMRELIAEWARYYNEWDDWKDQVDAWRISTDAAFVSLKAYVQNYFANLNVGAEVERIMQEMLESGEIQRMVEAQLNTTPRIIRGDLALNTYKYSTDAGGHWMQGGCYIGNGQYVVYYYRDDSDTGTLTCYDIINHRELWSFDLELYHGNTITYKDGNLYITPLYSYAAKQFVFSELKRVDLRNPSEIAETITFDHRVSSCVYDQSTDEFFFLMHGSASKAEYDGTCRVTDGDFNYKRTIYLEGYGDHPTSRTQGMQCAANGVIYEPLLDSVVINAYSEVDGHRINTYQVEKIFNKIRTNGEQQHVTYDFDNDDFYLGSTFVNNGFGRWRTGSIVKIDLTHSIEFTEYLPANWAMRDSQGTINPWVNVVADMRLKPDTRPGWFTNIADAVNLSQALKCALRIRIYHSPDGSDEPYPKFRSVDFTANEFYGQIWGQSVEKPTPVSRLVFQGSQVLIQNFDFKYPYAFDTAYGNITGAGCFINSIIRMTNNVGTHENAIMHCYNTDLNDYASKGLKIRATNSNINVQGNIPADMPDVQVSSTTSKVTGLVLFQEGAYSTGDQIPIKLHNRRGAIMASDASTLKIFWVYNGVHYPLSIGYDEDTRDLVCYGSAAGHTIEIRFRDKGAINDWVNTLTLKSIIYDGSSVTQTRIYGRM